MRKVISQTQGELFVFVNHSVVMRLSPSLELIHYLRFAVNKNRAMVLGGMQLVQSIWETMMKMESAEALLLNCFQHPSDFVSKMETGRWSQSKLGAGSSKKKKKKKRMNPLLEFHR